MLYYHCSPLSGLMTLQPNKSIYFESKQAVHLTSLLPMALMYGIKNYEYTYGFRFENGQAKSMYYDETFPNALTKLYQGKAGSLYVCAQGDYQTTKKPFEYISFEPVTVLEERRVPDLLAAFLDLEQKGELEIIRYNQQSKGSLDYYRRLEKEVIKKQNLLTTPGPYADYIKTAYPDSWQDALEEAKNQ